MKNTPPTGSYLTDVDFHSNYVLFYPQTEKHDYYQLYVLDTYRSLYNRGVDDEFRRNYIQSRLALVDWIAIDDTFLQQYQHGGYLNICMHPFVSGRALRVAMLDRLITRMKELPGVWFPSCEEVARWCLEKFPPQGEAEHMHCTCAVQPRVAAMA